MGNRIVAIVGMCGSGKSVAAEVFTGRGWQKIYFGGVTMDRLEELGLEKNEQNEKMVREGLRREHGPAAFAKLLLPKILEAAAKGDTVLDGLYSWSEYRCLKDELGDRLEVVAIVADREVRYKRLTTRQVRPLTPEQAQGRDYAEIENMEKGGPISIADRFILNNGGIDELRAAVGELIDGYADREAY